MSSLIRIGFTQMCQAVRCPYLHLSKSDPNDYSPYDHQRITTLVATLVATLVVGAHGVGRRCLLPIACSQLPVRTAVDVSDADML
ncbi:MAG: hypothetical protein F6K57_32925 [Moorea sp. SIO4A5]|nr:hypothetical protein [Moorena sp. SIO4A5]